MRMSIRSPAYWFAQAPFANGAVLGKDLRIENQPWASPVGCRWTRGTRHLVRSLRDWKIQPSPRSTKRWTVQALATEMTDRARKGSAAILLGRRTLARGFESRLRKRWGNGLDLLELLLFLCLGDGRFFQPQGSSGCGPTHGCAQPSHLLATLYLKPICGPAPQ